MSQHRGDALLNLSHQADPGNIIPASHAIAAQIDAIHVGDQIRMSGLLVDYQVAKDGREIFTRRTSLIRNDTDNGACEILYVTDLAVIAQGEHLRADAGRYMWYASLAWLGALAVVWVVRRPLAQ